jgi:predicted AAA+ superfamily ATPase
MKALILLRGLPGAGKSTLAKLLSENGKYPVFSIDDYFDVLKEIKRVLANDGQCIMRCFVRNPEASDIEDIIKEVQLKKIKNFGSLKWKIAMALVDSKYCSVEIKKISQTFNKTFKERLKLVENNLWDIETIQTIDSYDAMPGHFTFPTLEKLLEIFEKFFVVDQVTTLDYEMAKNCPTIVLRQK